MRDIDRKAVRSPSIDRNEYERLQLENAVSSFGNDKKPLENTGSLNANDIQKAQERFATKEMQGIQAPSRQRTESGSDREAVETETEQLERQRGLQRSQVAQKTAAQVAVSTPSKPELGYTTMFLMVGSALFTDTLQFIIGLIPFVGWILNSLIDLAATFSFWLWFKTKGIPFSKNQNRTFVVGAILEFIPIFDMLPIWTATISFMIVRYNKQLQKDKAPTIVQTPGRMTRA